MKISEHPLKILLLEDLKTDVLLIQHEFEKLNISCVWHVAENGKEYKEALHTFRPHIILSDHTLPGYNSTSALKDLKASGINVPFLLVTATVSEEFAVNILKEGAADYILKSHLHVLPPAVGIALDKHRKDQEQEMFFKNLIESEALLKDTERLARIGSWRVDLQTQETKWSDEIYAILDFDRHTPPSLKAFLDRVHPDDRKMAEDFTSEKLRKYSPIKFNVRIIDRKGNIKHLHNELHTELNEKGEPVRLSGFNIDITENVAIETALKKSEANLRSIVENTDTGYILIDKDLNIIMVNHRALEWGKITNRPPLNTLTNLRQSLTDDQRVKIEETLARVAEGHNISYEVKHTWGTDEYIWYMVKYSRILNAEREIIGYVLALNDITSQKKAQEKLEQSQSHMMASQRIAKIGSWEMIWNPDKPFEEQSVYWSDETYRIFGYEPGDVVPSVNLYTSHVHPDDRHFVTHVKRHINEGKVFHESEYRVTTIHGEEKFVRNRSELITHANGAGKIAGTIHDITDYKKAENELIKSEANLRTIFEHTEVSYVLLDRQMNVITFNQRAVIAFFDELGGRLEEGRDVLTYFKGDRKARLIKNCTAVLEDQIITYEANFDHPNGKMYWYYNKLSPIKDKNGKILGIIMARTDITEQKIAELERERVTMDLIQRNKDLEQFAYIISHNLRGPVANILGTTNILMEEGLNEEDKKFVAEGLMTSVYKLDQVIIDLNSILQVKQPLHEKKEPVKLLDLILDIQSSIIDLIDREKVNIMVDFEVQELNTIRSYLHSIFYNLISNSIKYGKPGLPPEIVISSVKMPHGMQITYTDNGLGIDLKRVGDQVFGLYKRFHEHSDGKGMGLFMVKTQVETLGGVIDIKSAPGEGVQYTISFTH